MVVGWALHACAHGSSECRLEHCNPFKRPTEGLEERQKHREKLLAIWLNSVSDDIDLIADWIFFASMYREHGLDLDGDMYSRATLALFVFTFLGSLSYIFELYQTVFTYPDTLKWLPFFTIVFEDVPQMLLTLVLSGAFGDYKASPTPEAAFNIATSLYNAFIKMSGEVFLNYCYCCVFVRADEKSDDSSVGSTNLDGSGFVSEYVPLL